jgi:hypothetical protein
MSDYLSIIAFFLLLTILWILWLFFRMHLQEKALSRVEERVNRIGKRLHELSGDSNDPDSKVYIDLVRSFNLQELWARVRTRIVIGRKGNERTTELIEKMSRLTSEIESLIRADFASRAMAQIGDWNEEKIAFFRDAGVNQRASIAAIRQLVADIKRELSR